MRYKGTVFPDEHLSIFMWNLRMRICAKFPVQRTASRGNLLSYTETSRQEKVRLRGHLPEAHSVRSSWQKV